MRRQKKSADVCHDSGGENNHHVSGLYSAVLAEISAGAIKGFWSVLRKR